MRELMRPLVYLRNVTRDELWLEDTHTGNRRKVGPGELVRVTEEMAARELTVRPLCWERVEPIKLGGSPAGLKP